MSGIVDFESEKCPISLSLSLFDDEVTALAYVITIPLLADQNNGQTS